MIQIYIRSQIFKSKQYLTIMLLPFTKHSVSPQRSVRKTIIVYFESLMGTHKYTLQTPNATAGGIYRPAYYSAFKSQGFM
jgi:hypothetical protein